MEEKEFEKYFERIEEIFHFGVYFDDCKDPDGSYTWDEKERKQRIKEILEEIEKDNYHEGYEACEMDIADSEGD